MRNVFWFAVVGMCVWAALGASAQTVGERVGGAVDAVGKGLTDAQITTRIATAYLLDDQISAFNINTNTEDGVVTISGSVVDEVQKQLAEDIARSVPGVVEVHNNIVVMDMPVPEPPKRSWGQVVKDRGVSAAIRSRLLYHKQFQGLSLDIHSFNGVVTLSGVVRDEDSKDTIERIAFDTRGVNRVVNNLVVRPKEADYSSNNIARGVSDAWIEKRVESALFMNRHVSIGDLNVRVVNGLCLLTGVVPTDAQKQLASVVASSVAGVREVRNNILVRELSAPEADPLEQDSGSSTQPEPYVAREAIELNDDDPLMDPSAPADEQHRGLEDPADGGLYEPEPYRLPEVEAQPLPEDNGGVIEAIEPEMDAPAEAENDGHWAE